jgi:predicted permease
MIFSSLFPVFALILPGNLLKRYKLTDETFLKPSDRLVYFVLEDWCSWIPQKTQ